MTTWALHQLGDPPTEPTRVPTSLSRPSWLSHEVCTELASWGRKCPPETPRTQCGASGGRGSLCGAVPAGLGTFRRWSRVRARGPQRQALTGDRVREPGPVLSYRVSHRLLDRCERPPGQQTQLGPRQGDGACGPVWGSWEKAPQEARGHAWVWPQLGGGRSRNQRPPREGPGEPRQAGSLTDSGRCTLKCLPAREAQALLPRRQKAAATSALQKHAPSPEEDP